MLTHDGCRRVRPVVLLVALLPLVTGPLPAEDCNSNGVDDGTDLAEGSSSDCNGNGVPDECDVAPRLRFEFPSSRPLRFQCRLSTGTLISEDLDGDGMLDLAAACAVFFGNGDGTFEERSLPLDTLWSHAGGDLDGDGDFDLVSRGFSVIRVLWNRGDRTFEAGDELDVGAEPRDVITLDADRDGDLDIATAAAGSVYVFLNEGDEKFGPPRSFIAGEEPWSLVADDVDLDGQVDIAVASCGSKEVVFLLAVGDGTFRMGQRIPLARCPRSIIRADFDGDGRMDLAAGDDAASMSILLTRGAGEFSVSRVELPGPSWPTDSLVAEDFDGDGVLDIATRHVFVLPGRGDGTFDGPAWAAIGGRTRARIAAGDYDGDGVLDLAVMQRSKVTIHTGKGAFLFTQRQDFPDRFSFHPVPVVSVPADFDGDGKLDVATLDEVFLGAGDGTFVHRLQLDPSRSPGLPVALGLVPADFDGDGVLDLAGFWGYQVLVLPGNGDGSFRPPMETRIPSSYAAVAFAVEDFDRDGTPDIVVVQKTTGLLLVLRGEAGNGFVHSGTFGVGLDPCCIVAADFDRDGLSDVAVANSSSSDISLLLGTGDGEFLSERIFPVAGEPGALAVADFDADGVLDLAATALPLREVTVLLGTGDGAFEPPRRFESISGATGLAATDFHGDGLHDLVVLGSGRAAVLPGAGDGTFQAPEFPLLPSEIQSVVVGDLDRDGLADLPVISRDAGLEIWGLLNRTPPPLSRDEDSDGVPDECGSPQLPGDCSQDGSLDISDAICLFRTLFLGGGSFPCGDGSVEDVGNRALLDWQGDGAVDLSDGVALLGFLFFGDRPHVLAADGTPQDCVRIADCVEDPGCR